MLREVVSHQQQADWDAETRLERACRSLRQIDAALVEWSWTPVAGDGVYLTAGFHVTDTRRPLAQLAATLRHIANHLDVLDAPPDPSPAEGPP